MTTTRVDVAVVGAGIVGLAHALAAARKGYSVAVFERGPSASGASVRNFGTIWPIGQPPGEMHELALLSRQLWIELLDDAKLPYQPTGSLHVMYRDDEADVAREFADRAPSLGYDCQWITANEALGRTNAASSRGLCGALWSPVELCVDPRVIASALPRYLTERYGVQFYFSHAVTSIELPVVHAGRTHVEASAAIVCSGDDLETLYPEYLLDTGITRCKLQMLRTVAQPNGWQLGPSLAGGLTLQHYASFKICDSLEALKTRIAEESPEINRWGIHILVSQTAAGEITLGDSHEYGSAVDVFDKVEIDRLILEWASRFLELPDWSIAQQWHGVYAKHPEKSYLSFSPAERVHVITALGGAGMTLSMALGEATVRELAL